MVRPLGESWKSLCLTRVLKSINLLVRKMAQRIAWYEHAPPRNVILKTAVGENDFVISVSLPTVHSKSLQSPSSGRQAV